MEGADSWFERAAIDASKCGWYCDGNAMWEQCVHWIFMMQ